jgi:glutamate/aspartate transport system substrate-binding protein
MKVKNAALLLATLGLFTVGAHAQDAGTLKKIKDTGVISLGHRESSIPFSYYDDKQNVIGYSGHVAKPYSAGAERDGGHGMRLDHE